MAAPEFPPPSSNSVSGGGASSAAVVPEMSAADRSYHDILQAQADARLHPLSISIGGQRVSFLFEHDRKPSDGIEELVIGHHRCRECADRLKALYCLSGLRGRILLSDDTLAAMAAETPDYERYMAYAKAAKNATTRPIIGLVALRGTTVRGFKSTAGGFQHYHKRISPEEQTGSISAETTELFEKAIHRYLIVDGGCMVRLMDRVLAQGLESFEILIRLLPTITYGETFLPAAQWLQRIVMELLPKGRTSCSAMSQQEMLSVLVPHLLNGGVTKDAGDMAVVKVYHTSSQVADLLECARDEGAIRKLIAARVDPTAYLRPTAAPTAAQVAEAERRLGDFTNTILATIELAAEHPGTFSVSGTAAAASGAVGGAGGGGASSSNSSCASSSSSAFALLRAAPKSFADRCSSTVSFVGVISVAGLIERLRSCSGSLLRVEIKWSGSSGMFLAKTTLPREMRSVPFFWAFSASVSCTTSAAWVPVSHIVPTWLGLEGTPYNNALFVVEGAKYTSGGNCCFPEFLSDEYSRVCGRTFEACNKAMPIAVPAGPIAAGLGVNTKNKSSNVLVAPVTVRITMSGGRTTEVTLTELA